MAEMFDKQAEKIAQERAPLASRLRPSTLDEVVGQTHLLGPEGSLAYFIAKDDAPLRNMILWGPPGTGKTTLAKLLAAKTNAAFETLSATSSGVKDIRALLDRARSRLATDGRATCVFIDEIHRFNKSQQDSLLHASEDGLITLIGATTENPSFEINAALLSRCRVHVLHLLDRDALGELLTRAEQVTDTTCTDDAREALLSYGAGDARRLLTAFETAADMAEDEIDKDVVAQALGPRMLRYDRSGDEHYDLASAMIKSIRGSDPDAAVYYAMRMLMGGEDPRFVVRRLAILASEDIGNADPGALNLAASAIAVTDFIGLPECEYTICQLATYLALAPKSNASAEARAKVRKVIRDTGEVPVPMNLRNAPTGMMKDMGYGKGYHYAHEYDDGFFPEKLLPESLQGEEFYRPRDRGFEARLGQRLTELRRRIEEASSDE